MTITSDLRVGDLDAGSAFLATHTRGIDGPECRYTRAAMHDYIDRRLRPRRQHRLEAHMVSCAKCIRAFIDIREISWARNDLSGTAAPNSPGRRHRRRPR